MPKIIYKQQHVGSNGRKFSPSRNAHYVKYIGEREHVLKPSHETNLVKYMGERKHAARQSDNGLFGYINGKFSDSYSTSEMQNYVRKISTSHRNVFPQFSGQLRKKRKIRPNEIPPVQTAIQNGRGNAQFS